MKIFEFLGFIIKYLLIGLGIAALFIVFMPEKFSHKNERAEQNTGQPGNPPKIKLHDGFADMLQTVKPAVVSIKARSQAFPLNSEACGANLQALPPETNACAFLNNGSGVFIDDQGHLVTNAHVLDKAATVIVELNQGQQLDATIIGVDVDSDIALLQVDITPPHYLPLPQQDNSRVGDWVFAIGTPNMAFNQTVTQGIISAKFFSRVSHYIQTDASLRPGNSGGALVNSRGELIGITSLSTRSEQGEKLYQSYAIVANNVAHVVQQLMEHGEVNRGWLGLDGDMTINIRSISTELNLSEPQVQQLQQRINQLPYGKGIVVTGINTNGPADQAGMQPLDIITKVNDKPIYNSADLISAIWNLPPESEITVEYIRGNDTQTTEVTLGRRTPQ
ncbi:trypsin-like peptidase domain-containing protein [Kangiella sediminilitoris]|uniref:PDZ/DHR/GLGF domain protein n=1 Tax=Kangiella sediminilitoris TaxID=1144748 RepID=A0A1B3BCG1_9GAMM|nr:trypsin-like peptidase domain-containing protein [Kangiella sediminilitoris]AOE50496.1 PDZ/DHR/GLGF domain protein [Kangiella sediminilitoris]